MTEQTRYKQQRYLLMTLDPIHPGAGGYRLGRVDNSIVREPGTRLPKIPGSSLHGAIRQYAAMQAEKPQCAGQNACGQSDCPICYTFGYVKGKDQQAHAGVVSIYDARILLFPVHTLNGPYWVTTLNLLKDAGFTNLPPEPEDGQVILTHNAKGLKRLNLGWLLLDVRPSSGGEQTGGEGLQPPAEWAKDDAWEHVAKRLAIVSEALFPTIVNSNLEVRTSVAINPETGAAEDGALYTYEAIPRATFLTCEVVLDDYRGKFEKTQRPKGWESPLDAVKAGLNLMQHLGVGGMGTRGFGRLKPVGAPAETSFPEGQS